MVTQSDKFVFDIDVTARLRRNEECKKAYKIQLLGMAFTEQQIDSVLCKYIEFLPAFNEVLNEVLSLPLIRTLDERDFEGLSSDFPQGRPAPN